MFIVPVYYCLPSGSIQKKIEADNARRHAHLYTMMY